MKRFFTLFVLILIIAACDEDITSNLKENRPPETYISIFTDSTIAQQKSKLTVKWWGDDPDGFVAGYFYKWEGLDDSWTFTTENSKEFSLPIGTVDTNFQFKVFAVDDAGNGSYDESIILNDVQLSEPFVDENQNGKWDNGEEFTDLGLADNTPAIRSFPIRNSAPEISWNKATVLPEKSFPVVTLAWEATDLDGDETIVEFRLSINDTSKYVTIPGNVRLVTLRSDKSGNIEVLVDGSEQKILSEKIETLKLNENNKIYLTALDISGSKSITASLPEEGRDWYVKEPKGNFLIIDDYAQGNSVESYYKNLFDNFNNGMLADKYDVLDLETDEIAYPNITFLQTLKLFDYVYWYSDSRPNLEYMNLATQKFMENGGKIAFSFTLEDSSTSFDYSLSTLQTFLPISDYGDQGMLNFLFPGASVLATSNAEGYPDMKTSSTIGFVRTYKPNTISAKPYYDLASSQLSGNIAFLDNSKSLFFIGLPLHQCDKNEGSVKLLLEKIFIEEFGLSL